MYSMCGPRVLRNGIPGMAEAWAFLLVLVKGFAIRSDYSSVFRAGVQGFFGLLKEKVYLEAVEVRIRPLNVRTSQA